jgi:hypothetical protein
MHHWQFLRLPLYESVEVHQTGHINRGDHLCICLPMVGNAILTHHAGHRFLINGEGTSKTATFISALQLHQFDSTQLF